MSSILAAKNITYKYLENSSKNILENFELELQENKITLLCGASGCGKSTLAYILSGLYPENGGFLLSGEVYIGGVNIHKLTPDKRVSYVSMMFQNCDLQFCMNNLKNELIFCLENINMPDEQMEEIIQSMVKLAKVEHLLYRDFNKMSGGEKQKCALCCILALKSRCIILDEAFANVDMQSAKEIIDLLKSLDVTILAIDHNIELWQDACDSIIYMDGHNTANRAFQAKKHTCDRSEDIIITRGLCVNDIRYPDMEFGKGRITAILGASGSGKSTFFKTLIGGNRYSGKLIFFGKELAKQNKHDIFSKCGIVFQNPSNQFLSMTVYDEILFTVKRWMKETGTDRQAQKTNELLSMFDLNKYKKYTPYLLSQGQQRRLAVLSMIAGKQAVLLLDEPTYGQDHENICTMMNLLVAKANEGLTIIFSTHNEHVAKHFADKTIRIGE